MTTATVTIVRKRALVQPYPKNGNVFTQKPTYEWWVMVDDRCVAIEKTLRKAKIVAADYGPATVEKE